MLSAMAAANAPAPIPNAATAPPASTPVTTIPTVPALYVGDLDPCVAEGDLFEAFSSVGAVASVRVCRDVGSGRSLGYGYVNYITPQDATLAVEKLNHTILNGRPIRIMWSHRDPYARNSGVGNLFVKNLSDLIDNAKLHEIFAKFGSILTCKIAADEGGKSKGYGFVQFELQESANSAIQSLNGSSVEGKTIYVAKFIRKSDRATVSPEAIYTNLYMKNLDEDINEELVKLKFSEFGTVLNVSIARDENGNSKGFGFVNFQSFDSAKRALDAMNGLPLGSKTLYVARAQRKSERAQMLRRLYEEKRNEQIRKYMASNVYVKNIDDCVDDDALREHFSGCGTITSAKVMCDDKGVSRGFGFVCYSTPEEANKAVTTLHGCMFHGKPLYVAIAQRKEERRIHLQYQFAQRMSVLSSSAAVVPASYPPVYYPTPGVVSQISPRQGIFYQPFGLRPGWRPSAFVPQSRPAFEPMQHSMPNTPRQHRQNRGQANAQVLPQPGYLPHLQQPNHSFISSKDTASQQQSGLTKYVPSGHQHKFVNGLIAPPAPSNPHGMEMLSSMLASATPQKQKQILGDRLFPLVEKLKFDLSSKITGMLLEMDNSELLLLLESPEALAAKVEEAVQVLELSKAKVGGQQSMHPKFLTNQVAVS